jgi:ornithine carbamoyltransferase
MRHIPNLKDLSAEEIQNILDRAATIKANPKKYSQLLTGESLAMLFQKTSTRTRVSFEVAMTELGGHAIYMDWMTSNFVLSGIEYETEYLSRNVSCIIARLKHHLDLEKIISSSRVPVINGCCEKFHPCQALTDILTVSEHYDRELSSAHIVYVGVQNNVSNSLAGICSKLGIQLSIATPKADAKGESLDEDTQSMISSSDRIQHVTDPKEVIGSADFVYTDTWIDMQYFNNPDFKNEKDARVKQMAPYQINRALVKGINCKIMHDMPIHDGYEITPEMVRDPRSIIFEQAENRLHAQKGLLWWLYDQAGTI